VPLTANVPGHRLTSPEIRFFAQTRLSNRRCSFFRRFLSLFLIFLSLIIYPDRIFPPRVSAIYLASPRTTARIDATVAHCSSFSRSLRSAGYFLRAISTLIRRAKLYPPPPQIDFQLLRQGFTDSSRYLSTCEIYSRDRRCSTPGPRATPFLRIHYSMTIPSPPPGSRGTHRRNYQR